MDQGDTPIADSERSGHPLFPRPETATGPDLRKFDLIQLRRWVDGKMEICPKTFRGTELRGWDHVVEMFGGGLYQAVGIDEKTHQFSCYSDKNYYAGPPMKPFIDVPQTPPPAPTPPAPPPAAHVPPGYYPPPPPGYMGGNNEMLAMMRVMFETILKVTLDNTKKDNNPDLTAIMLKHFLERQSQDPFEMLNKSVPVLQMLTGAGASTKQFMQGFEAGKEAMGSGGTTVVEKKDDLGDLATSFIKMVTTLKAGPAATNEPSTPKPAPAEPQPAAAAQVQTAAAKPKKRKSRPPVVPPGYAGMPPFGPAPFQAWPWASLPAHLYGMMQHPAYQAWAAQVMRAFPPPSIVPPFASPWGMPPMPNPPAPTPAPGQNAPPTQTPTPATPVAPPSEPTQKPIEAPVVEKPELEAAPTELAEEKAAEHVDAAQLDTAGEVEDATTLVDAADDTQGVEAPTKEFDPFASLRSMLAEAHASYTPEKAEATHEATPPTPMPTVQVPAAFPPSGLEPMMGAFALYMSAMQSNPAGMAIPPPTVPGELVDEEDDFDEDDEEDEEGEEERAPDVPVPEVPVPGVIAMAAADPEFEAALPEQLRPILRSLMGKPRGES